LRPLPRRPALSAVPRLVVAAALRGLVGIVVLLLTSDSDLSHAAAATALCGVFTLRSSSATSRSTRRAPCG